MCISTEILGSLSKDVYSKVNKYILDNTKYPGRIDRWQKTIFRLYTFNKLNRQRNEFQQYSCGKGS